MKFKLSLSVLLVGHILTTVSGQDVNPSDTNIAGVTEPDGTQDSGFTTPEVPLGSDEHTTDNDTAGVTGTPGGHPNGNESLATEAPGVGDENTTGNLGGETTTPEGYPDSAEAHVPTEVPGHSDEIPAHNIPEVQTESPGENPQGDVVLTTEVPGVIVENTTPNKPEGVTETPAGKPADAERMPEEEFPIKVLETPKFTQVPGRKGQVKVFSAKNKKWSTRDISKKQCKQLENSVYRYKEESELIRSTWFHDVKAYQKTVSTFSKTSLTKISRASVQSSPSKRMDSGNVSDNKRNAYNTTIKSAHKIQELFNVLMNFLPHLLSDMANYSRVTFETHFNEIKLFSERCNAEIYCLVKSGKVQKAKGKAGEAVREILKLTQSSGDTVMNVHTDLAKKAEYFATEVSKKILGMVEDAIRQLNSIEQKDAKLIKYIKQASKDIDALVKESKKGYDKILRESLGLLDRITNDSVNTIKRLGKMEVDLNKAITVKQAAETKALENKIQRIYKTFQQTNRKKNVNFLNGLNKKVTAVIRKFERAVAVRIYNKNI